MSGHFRHHPDEYEAAITEILGKAVAIYRHKNRIIVEEEKLGIEGTRDEITNRFSELRKAATTSTSFQGFAVAPSENSPSSMEYYDGKDVGSVTDERKGSFIHLPSRPSINANGVLGQILFDVCVPKTVEDWDIRSNSKNAGLLSGTRRHAPFNPIKCIRRSRL
jgi:farnesol dehydrogenase